MTHATGFEDRALGHLFETEVSEVRPLRVYLAEERPHRVHEPGVVYSYSNYGVALAGAILEQIHRRPWQEIIEREVIAPLGMAHTSGREPYPARTDLPEPLPAPLAALLAHGYRWRDGHHEMRPFNFVTQGAPAGAMSSTAADMARYMLLLLNGGTFEGVQVFGPATAQALGTPMTSFPRVVGNVHAGFFENQLPGGFSGFGHGGDVISFFSNMVIVPDLRMGIFVTTNTQGGGRLTGVLPLRIVERFYASAQQPPSASTALAASANAYDGYYLPTRRPSEGLQAFLFRLLASRVRVTPDGYLLLRMMGPPRRFVPSEDRDVFTSIESDGFPQAVRFVRAGGRAIRVETPVVALERVALLLQPPVLMSTAAATLLLSLATLLGVRRLFGRAMTALPSAQRVASWLQLAAAITWLVSAGAFAVAALAVLPDETVLLYEWPMHSMLVFSAAALVASLLTAVMMVAAPAVWRSSPTGWTIWRKLRYMATSVVFGACAALLTVWGALQPWNP